MKTNRQISEGAEFLLNRVFPVHVHGEVELVDYMGNDSTVARAARTSYQGSEGKTIDDDRRLIARLWKDKHTSPFEMVSLTFRIRLPIFVMRQHVRHRTASLNEWSFRYTECPEMFYVPKDVRGQSKSNKQVGDVKLNDKAIIEATYNIECANRYAYSQYKALLSLGVSREQARIVLPVSAYTQIIWNIDMRNLLHYLSLRLAPDAQREIRDYAGLIANIVKTGWPMIWEAYELD